MAFCTECGASVPDDVTFCTGCGKPMGEAQEPAPATAAQTAATVTQAPPVQARPAATTAPPPQYQQPQQQAPQQSAYAGDAPPPPGGKYSVIGTGGFIVMMILFAIPVVGWLGCIIMAFAAKNRNRRSFARAMLVFLILGLVISVALYFLLGWVWDTVLGYIQQYVSEATGGAVTDLGGLNNLLDLLQGLDGVDIPALPEQ
jgi:hypothetical protein